MLARKVTSQPCSWLSFVCRVTCFTTAGCAAGIAVGTEWSGFRCYSRCSKSVFIPKHMHSYKCELHYLTNGIKHFAHMNDPNKENPSCSLSFKENFDVSNVWWYCLRCFLHTGWCRPLVDPTTLSGRMNKAVHLSNIPSGQTVNYSLACVW